MAVVIPITFVSDAISQSVRSSGAGALAGQSIRPTAYDVISPSRVPTTPIAPGNALSARARSSTRTTESRTTRMGDPPGSGATAGRAAGAHALVTATSRALAIPC